MFEVRFTSVDGAGLSEGNIATLAEAKAIADSNQERANNWVLYGEKNPFGYTYQVWNARGNVVYRTKSVA